MYGYIQMRNIESVARRERYEHYVEETEVDLVIQLEHISDLMTSFQASERVIVRNIKKIFDLIYCMKKTDVEYLIKALDRLLYSRIYWQ